MPKMLKVTRKAKYVGDQELVDINIQSDMDGSLTYLVAHLIQDIDMSVNLTITANKL